jgi:hypothetical protein
MKKQLVFVHGRSQEFKDAAALKSEWVDTLRKTLDLGGRRLPIDDMDVRFPYYGQALYDLVGGADVSTAAKVILKGAWTDNGERDFIAAVAEETRQALGIDDAEVLKTLDGDVIEQGVQDWKWVEAVLRTIDSRVGGASEASVSLATKDVYEYLRKPGIRDAIEMGVLEAIEPGVPTVVVGHSLGSVVAYNLLRREGASRGWIVPLFITIGSPLAVKMIKKAIRPIGFPACVDQWFNARDPRDVVALYPLDTANFGLAGAIENKNDVDNWTPNRHSIAGYLSDPVVAGRIHDALV